MIAQCSNIRDIPTGVVHLDSVSSEDERISNRFVTVIASKGRYVFEEVLYPPYLVWEEDGGYHNLVIEDIHRNPEIHKNWVAVVQTVIGMSRQARWPYPHKRLSPIDSKKPTR
jgi:hypothetical protein